MPRYIFSMVATSAFLALTLASAPVTALGAPHGGGGGGHGGGGGGHGGGGGAHFSSGGGGAHFSRGGGASFAGSRASRFSGSPNFSPSPGLRHLGPSGPRYRNWAGQHVDRGG